jgi:hypothetical protein
MLVQHPVSVPFPSIAADIGIETVPIMTPIAAGVQTVATTTARVARQASEKARKKRGRQLDHLAEKEQNFKNVVEANIAFLKSQVGKNLHPMTTGPERTVVILVTGDQKPGVSVGDFEGKRYVARAESIGRIWLCEESPRGWCFDNCYCQV